MTQSGLTFDELKRTKYQLIQSVQLHEFSVEISALKKECHIPQIFAHARLAPF